MAAKNDLSRITIDIPLEDHKKLKMLAAMKGVSMRDIVMEAIKRQVAHVRYGATPQPEESPKVEAPEPIQPSEE